MLGFGFLSTFIDILTVIFGPNYHKSIVVSGSDSTDYLVTPPPYHVTIKFLTCLDSGSNPGRVEKQEVDGQCNDNLAIWAAPSVGLLQY